MKLGIGLVTYNRINYLKTCVERIQKFTTIPYALIVADDGSQDGTADWCNQNGIPVISGKNRGVVWNKNRAIYALMQYTCVDCFILLEEDCWPASETWAQQWYEAAYNWGHINYAHPRTIVAKGNSVIKGGKGTPSDPYRSTLVTGQCTGCSRYAIDRVGYLDSRFRGYGHGHVEWTRRFLRAGLGKNQIDSFSIYLSITGGLEPHDAPTNCTPQELERNAKVLKQVSGGTIYRHPWHNEPEKLLLISEVSQVEKLKIEPKPSSDTSPSYQLKKNLKLSPVVDQIPSMEKTHTINIIKLVTSASQNMVRCALDSPIPGEQLKATNTFNVKGWVVSHNSKASVIELISDGRIINVIPVNQSRPDVGKVIPQNEQAKNSGFSVTINQQELSIEAGVIVQVVLEDKSTIPLYLLRFDNCLSSPENITTAHLSTSSVTSDSSVSGLTTQQVRKIVLNEYKQIEALLNLHSLLPLVYPLPPLRGWAISPDFAIALYSLILERKIKNVLELGSGSSSLVIGYALQKLGRGKLISLEHDQNYTTASQDLVCNHKLEQYCQINYAPLQRTEVNGQNYKFYSLDCLKQINIKFDLLIIDGPPSHTNPLARFPAVPLLYDYLSDEAIICLDDSDRKDEKLAVQKWLQEYKDLKLMTPPTSEKGISVLKKIN
ncbi:MAG: class I SAM-dependent methyltransferase [Limnospira sp. PMC 737.11]|uniref:glycosyltransferase n=1 Tax=unclassified Limnospira TaxID=2642885 RepID=UPI00061B4167|nr:MULTISPECIES: glycosyltransferase [unclassified Limnospira]MDT9232850.1 class I SAM-dependent methyltransferase [Limnospira sp. PMC 917.15]MDT9273953.1 class I SAM-dependent methyltransferase [Limnospira sp. PMC 737.11]